MQAHGIFLRYLFFIKNKFFVRGVLSESQVISYDLLYIFEVFLALERTFQMYSILEFENFGEESPVFLTIYSAIIKRSAKTKFSADSFRDHCSIIYGFDIEQA